MLIKNEEVVKELFSQRSNQIIVYLEHIADSLNSYKSPHKKVCQGLDDIDKIVCKFRNHSSVINIEDGFKVKGSFSFRLATKGNH